MLPIVPIVFCFVIYLFGCFSLGWGTWDIFELYWSMRDLVPWQRIEPRPPTLGAWTLSHWTREVPQYCFYGLQDYMLGSAAKSLQSLLVWNCLWVHVSFLVLHDHNVWLLVSLEILAFLCVSKDPHCLQDVWLPTIWPMSLLSLLISRYLPILTEWENVWHNFYTSLHFL